MRHSLLVLLALAACGAAAETPVGGGAASPSAAAPSGDKKAAALPPHQRLQRLVTQAQHGANANQTVAMVRLAKEMVKGVVKKAESSLPAERTAISMLDCLTRAAATATAVPVHRGQLLVEHAKLLNALGRVDKAREMAEAATQVFESELEAWAANPEAGTPSVGPTSKAREHAAAALGSLLDVAALWRQLGREDEANALLEGALRAAPLIPSTPNFLRGLAQLSQLSEQQLDAALNCAVHLEREIGYTGAATIAATQQAESAPAAAATDALAEPGAGAAAAPATLNSCAWMKIKRAGANDTKPVDAVPDMHRLYYALHRGLHARKRYGAAWQALARAKVLHYSKHTYKQKDFQEMVDDVEQLFPSALKFVQAVAPEQPQEEQQADGGAVEELPAQGGSGAQQAVAGAAGSGQQPNGAADGGDSAGAAGQGLGAGTGGSSGRGGGAGEGEEMIPIFVMGLPRSGSTLAEQILSSHPQVYGAGEHSSLRSVTGKLQALIKGNGTVTRAQLDGFRRTYLAGMRSKIPPESRSSRWLVDKALSNAWLVGHIALMMPDACLVHAVRHPADAALSAFQQSFFPDKVPWSFNLTNVASHVRAHHRLMALWDRVLPGRVLHLHYAHMVQDQEATTRKLVEHCRLPWDPAFLRFYENERSVQTASQLQVKKPIYSSSLRKWPAYTQGLAPLLVELKDTILAYEAAAGLPLSDDILDQVQRELAEQQQQEQAAAAAAAEAQAAATSKEEL